MRPRDHMGGLVGLVHFRGDAPDNTVVGRMSAALAHRGPDGKGEFAEGGASFAHRQRRVSTGARPQPCVSPELVVMLDGWIYEHETLSESLGS